MTRVVLWLPRGGGRRQSTDCPMTSPDTANVHAFESGSHHSHEDATGKAALLQYCSLHMLSIRSPRGTPRLFRETALI